MSQAEAINDDPGVRMIQERIDGGSQRARTAYLLAARRGEPAGEELGEVAGAGVQVGLEDDDEAPLPCDLPGGADDGLDLAPPPPSNGRLHRYELLWRSDALSSRDPRRHR